MNKQFTQSNKKKFNVADIIIIIAALAIIVLITQLFFMKDDDKDFSKNSKITYQVELKNVPAEYYGAIKQGNTIFDDETGLNLGKVVAEPLYNDAYVIEYSGDNYKKYKYNDKDNITLQIKADVSLKDNQYMLDDFVFAAGNKFTLRAPGLIWEATVTGVTSSEPNKK